MQKEVKKPGSSQATLIFNSKEEVLKDGLTQRNIKLIKSLAAFDRLFDLEETEANTAQLKEHFKVINDTMISRRLLKKYRSH